MRDQVIYQRVLTISEDYLGPAAPRFLARLADSHLQKPAAQLSLHDLTSLIDWIQLAAMVITEDERQIRQYVARLEALRDSPSAPMTPSEVTVTA